MFGNYADNANTFDDAASATLLASTVYRIALLAGQNSFLGTAERVRQTIFGPASSSSSNNGSSLQHFTSDMWLTPVVNPHQFGVEGTQSPEGQAFVVELEAAWRDWVNAGSPGVNAASRITTSLWMWALVAGVIAALW